MAVHGKIDAAAFSNTIGVTNGDATVTKNAGDSVVVGDVLNISSVNYIVKQVTSTTAIELHKNYAGSTATVAAASVIRRTPPKAVAEYVIKGGDSNSNYDLVFVDTSEDGIASNKTRGITGPGWWLYQTYQTHNGTERHKAECLVPLKVAAGTAGDFAQDTIDADVNETITVVHNLQTLLHLVVLEHSLLHSQLISLVLRCTSGNVRPRTLLLVG